MAGGARVDLQVKAAASSRPDRLTTASKPPPSARSGRDPRAVGPRVGGPRTGGRGTLEREIAEVLFISPKTASVHVTHILNKLGVNNRVEAATIAVRVTGGAAGAPDDRPRAADRDAG